MLRRAIGVSEDAPGARQPESEQEFYSAMDTGSGGGVRILATAFAGLSYPIPCTNCAVCTA